MGVDNFLDFAKHRTRVLIFEDTDQELKALLKALAGTECEILVWDALGRPPTIWADFKGDDSSLKAFVRKQERRGYVAQTEAFSSDRWSGWLVRCPPIQGPDAAQADSGIRKLLLTAAAVVVDLGLARASTTKPCGLACCTGSEALQGFHILRDAASAGCLHKVLVSSGKLDYVLRIEELKQELIEHQGKGLSIFDKGDPSLRVAHKIRAWVRFDELGYYADYKTRDDLYMVGLRGPIMQLKVPERVLIVGNSGVGKQRAAEFIHMVGNESLSPQHFAAVHCGGLLAADFAKSHLFGHAVGAFTGATGHRVGVLLRALGCQAGNPVRSRGGEDSTKGYIRWICEKNKSILEEDGGILRVTTKAPTATIFLDEFQDLPADVQSLLLRVTEEGIIEPLGFDGEVHLRDPQGRLHIRFIGASNDPGVRSTALREDTQPGFQQRESRDAPRVPDSIRKDLVVRLSQWIVTLPDVSPEEVDFLIAREQEERGLEVPWHEDAKRALRIKIKSESFPGNRRQVRQLIGRAMVRVEHERASGMRLGRPNEVLDEDLRRADEPIVPGGRSFGGTFHTSTEVGKMLSGFIRTQVESDDDAASLTLRAKVEEWVVHSLQSGTVRIFARDLGAFWKAAVHQAWNDLEGVRWITDGQLANRGRTEDTITKWCVSAWSTELE
jgi:hypothetical protein